MAASEAEPSGTGRRAQLGSVYDGFISYSHAADDLLAPRLQAGLQKFAEPYGGVVPCVSSGMSRRCRRTLTCGRR